MTQIESAHMFKVARCVHMARAHVMSSMVIEIVSRKALMKCPLLHENIQIETDRETEKSML